MSLVACTLALLQPVLAADLMVTAARPIDAERLADTLRAYLPELGIRVQVEGPSARGDLRVQLANAVRAGEAMQATFVVRTEYGTGRIDIHIVNVATKKVVVAWVSRPPRAEDLYRALALKIQALLRSGQAEVPLVTSPAAGTAAGTVAVTVPAAMGAAASPRGRPASSAGVPPSPSPSASPFASEPPPSRAGHAPRSASPTVAARAATAPSPGVPAVTARPAGTDGETAEGPVRATTRWSMRTGYTAVSFPLDGRWLNGLAVTGMFATRPWLDFALGGAVLGSARAQEGLVVAVASLFPVSAAARLRLIRPSYQLLAGPNLQVAFTKIATSGDPTTPVRSPRSLMVAAGVEFEARLHVSTAMWIYSHVAALGVMRGQRYTVSRQPVLDLSRLELTVALGIGLGLR